MNPPPSIIFDRDNIKLLRDGDLSIFDYSLKNALLFSQGDWSLIRRDLSHAGVDDECIQSLEDGPCAELIRAFRIRREILNYKKVTLHLYEESRKIERDLRQTMAFFFWDDLGNRIEGSEAHLRALCSLAPSDLDEDISPLEIDAVKNAMQKHVDGEHCNVIDRKIMYVLATGAMSYNKGVTLAMHDARNITKAICMSPRHPQGAKNGERPVKLRTLPQSMFVDQAVRKAARENPSESRGQRKERIKKKEEETSRKSEANHDKIADFTGKGDGNPTMGITAFENILKKVNKDLSWPSEAVEFLSLSIAARGGFKALAIVEELKNYNDHVSNLPIRLTKVLRQYSETHSKFVQTINACPSDVHNDKQNNLSAAAQRVGTIHNLRGLLRVTRENAKWVSILASLTGENHEKTSRLFVASDDAAVHSTCMFLPKEFQLGAFIKYTRNLLDEMMIPTMLHAITRESWPPSIGTRRTRVLGSSTIQDAKVGKHKLQRCSHCQGYFSSIWIRHHLCAICERTIRNESDCKTCLFNCNLHQEAFCRHFKRCFVCDAPHTCEVCQLSCGNGEVSISMVETLRPTFLLLDFDRTLCSTKSGASPLPKWRTDRATKGQAHAHSIDTDLKLAVLAQQAHGSSYIVTRNSHKADIEEFLKMHGLEKLCVHVVPKKYPKGKFIQETFFSESPEDTTCIFIDDDIRELVKDPWLRDSKQVHRLLFVRGMSR